MYGLGSVNRNLPGFVVFAEGGGEPFGGARNWGTGYMPATYQGTLFRSGPNPILNLSTPADVGGNRQKDKLELIGELNDIHRRERPGDTELDRASGRLRTRVPDAGRARRKRSICRRRAKRRRRCTA